MSRTYKDRYTYKGWIEKACHHSHHGEQWRLIRPAAWFFKPPSWFTNKVIVRAERQDTRIKLIEIVKVVNQPQDEDCPMFAKGNKPNADWKWT